MLQSALGPHLSVLHLNECSGLRRASLNGLARRKPEHSIFFRRPVPNTSKTWSLGALKAARNEGGAERRVPNTLDDLTRDDISPRGEPEHFSGQPDVRTAALEPSDEHVLLTRFSVETRTIHERDWLSGMGAPSADGTCADPPPVEWFRNVLQEDTRGRKRVLEARS